MARLPTFQDLGERPVPRPSGDVVQLRSTTGAETAPGTALAQVGNRIESESDKLYTAFKVEQEKTDTIKVEDAWNQYKNHALELAYNDKDGLLNTKGGDAVNNNLLGRATASLTDARAKITDGLNDEQRQRFEQRANATDLQTKQHVLVHLATEQRAYAKTTFEGSDAAARAQVRASPTDPGVFAGARETLMRQTDDFLRFNGITDKGKIDELKGALTDGLWTTRIESLLDTNPILADAMLRQNAAEITNSQTLLTLRAKTGERASIMQAGLNAENEVGEAIRKLTIKAPPAQGGRTTPEDGPASGTFENVVGSLLKREGGYVAKDGKSGAPANFGINQKYNPDIEVKGLTRERAIAIYRERYWDKIDGDTLAPATALVALDAAALQGPEVAKKLIADTGGDPIAMLDLRRTQLAAIAAKDPEQRKNLAGWNNRLDGLYAEVNAMPDGMIKVGAQAAATYPQTSSLPNARDLAAQLPGILAKGEKLATDLYGPDKMNPARFAFMRHYEQEARTKLNSQVAQLTAVQKDSLDDLTDFVSGFKSESGATTAGLTQVGGRTGTPGMMITSMSQLQSNPAMMAKFQQLDAAGRRAIDTIMRVNSNADSRGDPALLNEMRNRVYLPVDDPNRLNTWSAIVNDPRVQAGTLNPTQLNNLRTDWERAQSDEGRSYLSLRKNATTLVRGSYQGDVILTNAGTNRAAAELAESLWTANADKVVAQYNKENKPTGPLFDPTAKESLISPTEIGRWKAAATGMVSGLPAAAAAVKDGKQAPLATPPIEIKSDAEFDALPPGARYRGPGDPPDKFRLKPGQPAASPGTRAGSAGATPAPDAPTGTVETGAIPQQVKAAVEPDYPLMITAPEDAIPDLVEGPGKNRYLEAASPERKAANAARQQAFLDDLGPAAMRGIEAAGWAAGTFLRLVTRGAPEGAEGAVKVAKALVPSEQERVATQFRDILAGKQAFRANESTYVLLNNFLASGKGTEAENAKAQRMVKLVGQKIGILQTPEGP